MSNTPGKKLGAKTSIGLLVNKEGFVITSTETSASMSSSAQRWLVPSLSGAMEMVCGVGGGDRGLFGESTSQKNMEKSSYKCDRYCLFHTYQQTGEKEMVCGVGGGVSLLNPP